MAELASEFFQAFLPILIAMDVVGITPVYLALTQRLEPAERSRVLRGSLLVAAGVSLGFALLGKGIFLFVGITVADFQIAGGLILLGFAALELLGRAPLAVSEHTDVGVVPLGVPVITGPAVITITIAMVDLYGMLVTVSALLANLAICWLVLAHVTTVERLLGRAGMRALSKIISLFLAAIGVRLIRQGWIGESALWR